jgi:hypothetical protein
LFYLTAGYRLAPVLSATHSITHLIVGGLRGLANARDAAKHSRPGLFCIALILSNEPPGKKIMRIS